MEYAPCKECNERVVDCHSKCPKYAVFLIENRKKISDYRRGKKAMLYGGKAVQVKRDRNFQPR